LQKSDAIDLAERVPAKWLCTPPPILSGAERYYGCPWSLRDIEWLRAQPLPDASHITVAVLDTGVDQTHPSLSDAIKRYKHDPFCADDLSGHGTHVCGIIGAKFNDRTGVSGVANCSLAVWKVFPDQQNKKANDYMDYRLYLRRLERFWRSRMLKSSI
jgi:hypothetical protein